MATRIASFSEIITSAIKKAITEELENIYEAKKQEMIEEMDKKKDETIAGLTINIFEMVQMQDFGKELRITIQTDKLKDRA